MAAAQPSSPSSSPADPAPRCPFSGADNPPLPPSKASDLGGAATDGLASAKLLGGAEPLSPAPDSFIARKVSNIFDGADPTALLKALTPTPVLLGVAMLIASAVAAAASPAAALALSVLLLLPTLLTAALRGARLLSDPSAEVIVPGIVTDAVEGEFCVFLLGSRVNNPWTFSGNFAYAGQAFMRMITELERLPASAGYLGGDSYVGSNTLRSSHTMVVTYWRSYDHLMRYTHDAALAHSSAMRHLADMRLDARTDIGLWHEAYVVGPGRHESVYINCPPLGLGAASGLQPAKGALSHSRGRMRATGDSKTAGLVTEAK